MTVFVLVVYGVVVGAFRTWDAAIAHKRHHYDQDEYRVYECQVRES